MINNVNKKNYHNRTKGTGILADMIAQEKTAGLETYWEAMNRIDTGKRQQRKEKLQTKSY